MTELPDIQQGQYLVILAPSKRLDLVGFEVRRSGLEVRDCCSIQTATDSLVGLLVRKPLETTVLESVLRDGAGTLDLDRCRIDHDEPLKYTNRTSDKFSGTYNGGKAGHFRQEDSLRSPNQKGRFPTNLIYVHNEGCVCEGTKKIKSQNPEYKSDAGGTRKMNFGMGDRPKNTGIGYANADGTEDVPNWNCEPTCSVRLLDGQSGILSSGYLSPQHNVKANTGWSGGSQADRVKQTFESNSGGASRFFYQATNLEDLEHYLAGLVGSRDLIIWA